MKKIFLVGESERWGSERGGKNKKNKKSKWPIFEWLKCSIIDRRKGWGDGHAGITGITTGITIFAMLYNKNLYL